MKVYEADREKWGRSIKVNMGGDFYWLDPRPSQKMRNHSPDGFEWGYGGSGPAQLALAILLDLLGEDHQPAAQAHYQNFKDAFIAHAAKDGFRIEDAEVFAWLRDILPSPTV